MSSTPKRMKTETANKLYATFKFPLILGSIAFGVYPAIFKGGWSWFSWHPFVMSVAFIGVAGIAVLVKKIGGLENTRMHANLMYLICLMMAFAFYVIWSNKEAFGKSHYTSYHSWMGLTIMGIFLSGAVGATFGLHPDYGKIKTNQNARALHKWSGRFFVFFAWMTCFSGYYQMQPDALIPHVMILGPMLVTAAYVLLEH